MENYSRDATALIMETVAQALKKVHGKYRKIV
jgi:hypothetical protein